MIFVIITHVPHILFQNQYFAYAPYVREMNIWTKGVDKLIIVAPKYKIEITDIDINYEYENIEFIALESFDLLSLIGICKALIVAPNNIWKIYLAMQKANHIHLRCPGNIGLLGCFVQILFPKKNKTAKYAGNWDLKSPQPLTYRLQKWILNNTFLTRKMKVLVYGEWENSTRNIKPFFTASYFEKDKFEVKPRNLRGTITFLFVGALAIGKQPLYAIQLVEQLYKKGNDVQLAIYGEGSERDKIEKYILENNLQDYIFLKGNQNQDTIKKAYIENHFVVLPSLSEGWPKVVAEGMFWGCMPITTKVSCLSTMLDNGKRGVLLNLNLDKDVEQVETIIKNQKEYNDKVLHGINWSRQYTFDAFEYEIKLLLNS